MSAILAAARAAIGVPFRPQGRDPAFGLDCVGLAALALRAGGYAGPVPEGYRRRCGALPGATPGLARVTDPQPGDLLLFETGPGQLHLAIASEQGLIHADATLGRVVERPGAWPWPLVATLRLVSED